MIRTILMAPLLVQLAAAATGQTPSPAEGRPFSEVAAELDRQGAESAAKGGSFLLAYQLGEQLVTRGYGPQKCSGEGKLAATALFDMGSLTKQITGAAIYKLVEQGRLKLDDRLGELLPGVPADKRAITVAQILDHRAGLIDFMDPNGRVLGDDDYDLDAIDYVPMTKPRFLQLAMKSPLLFAPGTDERYSNTGYQLLAAIIEARSGIDYEQYVRTNLLLPAGMRNTGYRLGEFAGLPIAEQCRGEIAWGDPLTKGKWRDGVSWFLIGAGGMMTTLTDMTNWNRALARGTLLRKDIQTRFRKANYRGSRTCGEIRATAGSNALTLAQNFHRIDQDESLILVSVRSDRQPRAKPFVDVICARKPAT